MKNNLKGNWIIRPRQPWFRLQLGELCQYKDLLFRFVRRDLLVNYQQTLLGPFWVFLQPLLTTCVYFLIFRRFAKISTDGIPPFLFYLPGIIVWNFFSESFVSVMYTFIVNTQVFSKVYFPRLLVPVSSILSMSVRLLIQCGLFVVIYLYYLSTGTARNPNGWIFLIPFLFLLTAAFALGWGLLICVFTAKYRDLDHTIQFILRLFMFAAPVVYPASIVPESYRFLFWLNPLTSVIETFRAAFFGNPGIQLHYLWISVAITFVILFTGLVLFKKRETEIMDVI